MLPAVYALVAYVVIWGTGLGSFPNPPFLRESFAAVGIDAMSPWAAAMLMVLLNAVYGFIRSCANALGEEIGWRGLLTPQLVSTRGFTSASLITGGLWAVWHYPILLFADYNFGTPGWYAVSCLTVMIIGLSVIYTWFRLRTGSLWTATFLHASHNLFIQGIFTPLTLETVSLGRPRRARWRNPKPPRGNLWSSVLRTLTPSISFQEFAILKFPQVLRHSHQDGSDLHAVAKPKRQGESL